jgi:hypothetical protein
MRGKFAVSFSCMLETSTKKKLFYVHVTVHSVTNFFLIKITDAPISQIYFCQEILHVSGSSSVHHQEFSTVYSTMVYVINFWWHTPEPNIRWKTADDGQRNCPKHVEFLDKNKFGKLVRLLVLLKREEKVTRIKKSGAELKRTPPISVSHHFLNQQ